MAIDTTGKRFAPIVPWSDLESNIFKTQNLKGYKLNKISLHLGDPRPIWTNPVSSTEKCLHPTQ